MKKYTCYYTNDFGDHYTAFDKEDANGEWYRASDVDARIAELEKALQEILGMATETVNQKTCEVPREVLGRARDALMVRESQ